MVSYNSVMDEKEENSKKKSILGKAKESIKSITNIPSKSMDAIKEKIRKKAIEKVKVRLDRRELSVDDLTLDEYETLIEEEEKKINDTIRNWSFRAIAAYLGIDFLLT
ncbi:MAG: hypothetical protein U9N42_09480 [Campylobacterota bacterium]|nr:hypothetical protein [Campylobacterota bacterium]